MNEFEFAEFEARTRHDMEKMRAEMDYQILRLRYERDVMLADMEQKMIMMKLEYQRYQAEAKIT